MASLLAPRQLGYCVRGGAEAAVHAARLYMKDLQHRCVLKLDFRNAFNTLRRDKMLQAVQNFAPDLFSFVHASYSSPSSLFWSDKIIQSVESVQQGDPLGPLLFCLTIHPLVSQLKYVVEASRREARVPHEGDPVSALPTTPCVSSTSDSSPCCLLDVRLVLWGLWEAIFANNSACVMSDTYPCS